MADIQSGWHRRGMRSHLAGSSSTEVAENILSFREDLSGPRSDQGASAIRMVHQAAELIRKIEQQAADVESRAQDLAKRLIVELELAERRLCSAEAERQATEADINEANLRVHEAGIALENAESIIASTEARLSAAEQRADEAEARAKEAGAALVRIEDAIRTHLLGAGRFASNSLAAAA
jgi:chromosome segregation ATPase